MNLEEMSVSRRVLVTVVIVVIIIILLACANYMSGRQEAGAVDEPLIVTSKWDKHIDELEKQAIDDAFKKHIAQLYSVWVTDNYHPRIPPRALTGARNARDAYIRSMKAIEEREQIPLPIVKP